MRRCLCLLLAGVLAGCSSGNYAPVVDIYGGGSSSQRVTRGVHVVSAGETLYSIAWRYGWDFSALARANGIRAPYTIFPGQKIRLDAKVAATTASRPASTTTSTSSSSTTASRPQETRRDTPPPRAPATVVTGVLQWQWPGDGPLLGRFSANKVGQQGILIGAKAGAPVRAAEAGQVVYRGNGLTGYGNLLIIKHNDQWLSAYAHNERLLVTEGDNVKAGQQIATVGNSGTFRTQLHFEIRRNGSPVDPLRYLPGR